MTQGITQFPAGTMAKGINVHVPDFTTDITLDANTVNVTSGIHEGIGPRYGMSPIPGQMDQEAVNLNPNLPGLMLTELGYGLSNASFRTNIYGLYSVILGGAEPLTGGTGSILNTRSTYYFVIIGYNNATYSGKNIADVTFLSTRTNTTLYGQSPDIYDGLPRPAIDEVSQIVSLVSEYVQQSNSRSVDAQNLVNLTDVTGLNLLSSAPFAVSGQDNPAQWLLGLASSTGDATHAPQISLTTAANFSSGGGALGLSYTGWPSPYSYQGYAKTSVTSIVYSLNSAANPVAGYQVIYNASSTIYIPTYVEDRASTTTFNPTSAATTLLSSGTYADTVAGLISDPSMTINSAYKGVLVCGKNPFAVIFQDWARNPDGLLSQYIDLVNMPLASIPTFSYTQEGTNVPTSFRDFPEFIRGTPLTGLYVNLGGENTGNLRSNTVYEFTYSLYDKRLNYETNVGIPVKVQTGDTDLIALQIYNSDVGGQTQANTLLTVGEAVLPYMGSGPSGTAPLFHINYLEYRFYYRVEGNTTWIPTLQMDAAQFWYSPHLDILYLAQSGVGSNIGGYPGGFQDYSTLPGDQYTCAIFYKNRAFWISDKALIFSLNNNILAYPARNSVACPSGNFKGAIFQAYYGQADQDARLVVFSTNGTFVGKFTGNLLQVPVQLGDGTQANFGLDGSDFVLNSWTSATAFSYRTAVVAEGILYFWGPTGVWMDDGVNPIQRVSIPLEPDLFTSYDPAQTDAFNCTYNDTTKEIYWFYIAPGATVSSAYVYNIVRQTWLLGQFSGLIDAAQQVNIATGIATAGSRTVVYQRANSSSTIQRAYFFDQRNRAGDYRPTTEAMVKSFVSPSTGVRRLTLAAGTTGPLSLYAAGDTITIQQFADYTGQAPGDLTAVIAAVNAGGGTVDITLPPDAVFPASFTASVNQLYFPIWQASGQGGAMTAGVNGIPYVFSSKYWIPAGMAFWAYWQYLHLLFKADTLLPNANNLDVILGYKTPISPSYQQDILTLQDNSDANCQILHQLTIGNMNAEGQGLKIQLSGVQIGSEWVLQYLEAYTRFLDGLQINVFEG